MYDEDEKRWRQFVDEHSLSVVQLFMAAASQSWPRQTEREAIGAVSAVASAAKAGSPSFSSTLVDSMASSGILADPTVEAHPCQPPPRILSNDSGQVRAPRFTCVRSSVGIFGRL